MALSRLRRGSSLMSNLLRRRGTCAARGIDESTSPQGRHEAGLARHEVEVNSSPHYEAQGPLRPHPNWVRQVPRSASAIIRKLIAVAERLGRTTEAAKLRRLLR